MGQPFYRMCANLDLSEYFIPVSSRLCILSQNTTWGHRIRKYMMCSLLFTGDFNFDNLVKVPSGFSTLELLFPLIKQSRRHSEAMKISFSSKFINHWWFLLVPVITCDDCQVPTFKSLHSFHIYQLEFYCEKEPSLLPCLSIYYHVLTHEFLFYLKFGIYYLAL